MLESDASPVVEVVRTGLPGRNLMDSGLGVSAVWMNMVRRWIDIDVLFVLVLMLVMVLVMVMGENINRFMPLFLAFHSVAKEMLEPAAVGGGELAMAMARLVGVRRLDMMDLLAVFEFDPLQLRFSNRSDTEEAVVIVLVLFGFVVLSSSRTTNERDGRIDQSGVEWSGLDWNGMEWNLSFIIESAMRCVLLSIPSTVFGPSLLGGFLCLQVRYRYRYLLDTCAVRYGTGHTHCTVPTGTS